MSGSEESARPRVIWSAIAIGVLLVGGIVWGVVATSAGRAPVAGDGASASASVPPTPSVFPTPTAGPTGDVPSVAPTEVSADQPATVEGVTARIVEVVGFDASSTLPGDVAGPAVRVTVEVTNAGTSPADTSGAALTVDFGDDRVPGSEITGDSSSPLPAMLSPGETVTAVSSFAIPDMRGDAMRVVLDLLAGKPAVVFESTVPTS